MIKVEAIKDFKLARYDELKNIVRKSGIEEKGLLKAGDTFECTKELCDYLMGDNAKKEVVVKVIEIIPEEKPEIDITENEFEIRSEEVKKHIYEKAKEVEEIIKPKSTKKKSSKK